MELSAIKPFLIYQFKSDQELVQTISQISKNFTSERENLAHYLEDPRMVAAYTAFYMTTNIPKLDAIMLKLGAFVNQMEGRDIVDIGCGPGTFLLALRQKYHQSDKQFIGIETSALMRKQALRLADGLGLKVVITEDIKNITVKDPLVIFGHSANEMGAKTALKYVQRLDAHSVLFIEPGTKQAFAPLMEIRESLLESSYDIQYPCPNNESCPMAKDKNDWCHQYLYVQQNSDVARLGQMVKKNRNLLPITVHAYLKQRHSDISTEKDTEIKRVVRYLRQTKHSFEWQLCVANSEKNGNKLLHVELPKRSMSKKEIKQLEHVFAGDELHYQEVRNLDNGKVRILLS